MTLILRVTFVPVVTSGGRLSFKKLFNYFNRMTYTKIFTAKMLEEVLHVLLSEHF